MFGLLQGQHIDLVLRRELNIGVWLQINIGLHVVFDAFAPIEADCDHFVIHAELCEQLLEGFVLELW